MFTKVTNTGELASDKQTRKLILCSSQDPGGPNKWVVEESQVSPGSAVSPLNASAVLEAFAKREQSKKTQAQNGMKNEQECSVLMWNEKMFFPVVKQEPDVVIDLCDDEVSKVAEKRAEGKGRVRVVGCSAVEEGSKEKATSAPEDLSFSTQLEASEEKHTQKSQDAQTSSSRPASCPVADSKLKQMFGITSEVEIRLPRVDGLDPGRSCTSQAQPLDYTRPIEEDFPCDSAPPHSQDCAGAEVTSSRVGRTRKRTKCPCCSPGGPHWYHKTRTKPKYRRSETVRNLLAKFADSETVLENAVPVSATGSAPIPVRAVPDPVTLHTDKPDCEELQIHKDIQLLREALRLKEAALERLQNHKNCQ
ncbi:hypothetical protein WMY93_027800 [Mugilogobius chulae]|uniref:Uncharacterized protein n=1 Tax=Mugilogobius chulae TaxID=88201 RepID=A0AAW0MYA9_9GOBI